MRIREIVFYRRIIIFPIPTRISDVMWVKGSERCVICGLKRKENKKSSHLRPVKRRRFLSSDPTGKLNAFARLESLPYVCCHENNSPGFGFLSNSTVYITPSSNFPPFSPPPPSKPQTLSQNPIPKSLPSINSQSPKHPHLHPPNLYPGRRHPSRPRQNPRQIQVQT